MYKDGVLAFYINSRKQPKQFTTSVDNNDDEKVTFVPSLSILVGGKTDKLYACLLKQIKNMGCFYKYTHTKNKFRHVDLKEMKNCVERVARLCENNNFEIVYSNIHNM